MRPFLVLQHPAKREHHAACGTNAFGPDLTKYNAHPMSLQTEGVWTAQSGAAGAPRTSRELPFVSVIVPVYNDARRLRLCLEALARQTYPAAAFEILVIDNDSDDDVAAVCSPY